MTPAVALILVGCLFLAGLAIDILGRRTEVPRVTLLILLGVGVGPAGLDLLPGNVVHLNEVYAPAALTMVAFLLGGTLRRKTLEAHGRQILVISITVVFASVLIIAGGLFAAGIALPLALMLGGVSAATDPATTRDVVRQAREKGRFATNLQGIVAIDDAWGVLLFSATLTLAGIVTGGDTFEHALRGLREVTGALALGAAIGFPAAYLTGRIRPGEPTLIEALGIVCLCAGLAQYLGLSFLLTGMTAGAVIVNLASHHERPFHEIEHIEWPFMLLFFVLAGAMFRTEHLAELGMLGAGYILLRIAARLFGGWLGGRLAGLPNREAALTGLALMPQAGVAIGMALVASERFPQYGPQIVMITIASTIAFELIGPIMTQIALRKMRRPSTDTR